MPYRRIARRSRPMPNAQPIWFVTPMQSGQENDEGGRGTTRGRQENDKRAAGEEQEVSGQSPISPPPPHPRLTPNHPRPHHPSSAVLRRTALAGDPLLHDAAPEHLHPAALVKDLEFQRRPCEREEPVDPPHLVGRRQEGMRNTDEGRSSWPRSPSPTLPSSPLARGPRTDGPGRRCQRSRVRGPPASS